MALIVGQCRGNGIYSQTIGWFGGGYFSHTTTLLPDKKSVLDSRNDHVGGMPAGVQIRPISYLYKEYGDNVFWYRIPCTELQESKVYTALDSQIGKPYDRIGILNYLTGKVRDRNWTDESAWFCSELAVWSWLKAGILGGILAPSAAPCRVTPGGSLRVLWGLHAIPLTKLEVATL